MITSLLLVSCVETNTGSTGAGAPTAGGSGLAALQENEPANRVGTINKPAAPVFSEQERDPTRLVNLVPTDVSKILGEPMRVRKEASMRVWQYRIKDCVLDLFLYKENSAYRVIYYEFRSARFEDQASAPSGRDCMTDLLTRVRTQSAQS